MILVQFLQIIAGVASASYAVYHIFWALEAAERAKFYKDSLHYLPDAQARCNKELMFAVSNWFCVFFNLGFIVWLTFHL